MRNIFKRNLIWSFALYQQDTPFSINQKLGYPFKIFNSKKHRNSKLHVHTYADPFLFVYGNELYVFFESRQINEPGKIEVYKTSNLTDFIYLGVILKESFHLSYPFVFNIGSHVYMIPETEKNNEVALYKFNRFPNDLVKIKTLLQGSYADTSLVYIDEIYYLFISSEKGLDIFYTTDLEHADLKPHPDNPVSTDEMEAHFSQ